MNQTDSYTRSIHRTGRAGSLLAILWMLDIPAVMCGILVKLEYVGICRSDIIIEKSEQGFPGPFFMALAEFQIFEGAGTNHRLLTQYLSAL